MGRIIIENLLRKDKNKDVEALHAYCFSGKPRLFIRLYGGNGITLYNEEFKIIDDVFSVGDKKINKEAEDLIKQTYVLSQKLSQPFNFVRVDWMVFNNKIWFEELTFTPYSGFHKFRHMENNLELGNLIKI